ncbi:Rrf2 family transcriptional regulator [Pedobacter metabolipauper]|uniref:BadM/Rrf2 family transcriptional regulator n=1 Tax=Pedobacter metabolipauper TaxID=425513 RepID=A0A4R6SSD4_9SPHI|nr:Rrf2 family transcriptional regulator [Pedobacter metabolipauper]TDQ07523.1 BadM/Rrf2 family transcriptional regulator [Pedobacter metabolipauper]
MNNSRFAISLHILTLLEKAKGELLSSEWIAGSININPVLVRKELGNLRSHGLVNSKEGKNGGSYLEKAADQISLAQVYHAVKQDHLLGVSKNTPNPLCQVGKQINMHLNTLYDSTEQTLISELSKQTLADFSSKFI